MSTASPTAPALPAEGTLIEANNLQLMQRRATVLEGVSFSIQQGELVYLIGRTGSGKSTLLRTLFADLRPAAGSLRVERYRIERLREREVPYLRRRIGIVFQDFQLLPDRSVAQNLAFALRATGWRDGLKIKARSAEVLDRVHLASKSASYPHQLSGGEQQRVAIARALLNEPVLLLADEPTGNLDPETAATILDLLADINRAGTAILMATHAHTLIQRAPGRVLEVRDGRVIDRGHMSAASSVFA
jgi:cell division transport system ATP-binding protein